MCDWSKRSRISSYKRNPLLIVSSFYLSIFLRYDEFLFQFFTSECMVLYKTASWDCSMIVSLCKQRRGFTILKTFYHIPVKRYQTLTHLQSCCEETLRWRGHRGATKPFPVHNKRLFISSEGFSTLEKTPDMLSEGDAAHPVGCDSPLQIVMAVWSPFCLNSNFLGWAWQHSADNNSAPKSHYYLQKAVTPDQITQQNSLQRAEAP